MSEHPSILFVCMGNICRSPTAEAVCRKMAHERGIDLEIDSAGTIAYHAGERPDARSEAAGVRRGYDFTGMTARQVTDSDFSHFDYILAADLSNLADLNKRCPAEYQHKLSLLLAPLGHDAEVPDPYYGGARGFEQVLDLLEQACEQWLSQISGR
ncbi:low molecular weight protein-tyrosine-phosphatase [Shewanella sp. GXUN23E]|uniref:low molecular weight protein-tyrosine-phosphatase n=1 Tax=Shewanella sp. GXUN23E TaxID=3422498 RepID=UPI003D7DE9B9